MAPSPGDPVRVEMTKWGDAPHWENDAVLLGSDVWGDWVGAPVGTRSSRPGATFLSAVDTVTLAPTDGWYAATFHRPGTWVTTYVDITTPPCWDGAVLRAVDLDLDVVRRSGGVVYVDDEDEFAEHQVALGYPPEVIVQARRACDAVLGAVQRREAPFDATSERWFEQLDRLLARA